ncbi:CAMK protein kinase [Sporothrix schenckii ATCC 58251]|uniref:CAMK protein kinase n=1 Tax=Sporothrix schenckii (strain ATCC 58251 / de Perez 2211183) TaxID=1391915 RepID=U7PQL3_SPOS1|nr:CAMK protein kinase [Sporothrix schenckii ATCC 58251]
MNLETADIRIGNDLHFQIQHFDDPVGWKNYCEAYARRVGALGIAGLGLSTQPETTNASKKPPVYILDRRLGKGADGEVYRAVERRTGDVYAMKLYHKPEKARWQEPATLQRLNHEHIVRYVAYSHVSGQSPQLIMEYVEGPNLQEYMDPRNNYAPLRMSEAREVLRQLLEALAYLNDKNVTHRDVKPANIILVSRHPIHTKLVDFGYATDVSSFKTNCGTPLYLAPELFTRRGGWSYKVDIFAMAVVALNLLGISVDLTNATEPRDYLRTVLRQRRLLTATNQSPPAQYDLVVQLLAKRPDDRPSARKCLDHGVFQDSSDPDDALDTHGLVPDLQTQIFLTGRWHGEGDNASEIATEIADTPSGPLPAEAETASGPSPVQEEGGTGRVQQRNEEASASGIAEELGPRSSRHAVSLRSTARRSGRQSSSSVAEGRKRQKQSHAVASRGGRPTRSARSTAPSPPSRRRHRAPRSSIASVLSGAADQASWDYNSSGNVVDTDSDLPDTASYGSVQQHQWASDGGRQAPEQTGNDEDESGLDLHDGCWMDPMHALGGFSSVSRLGQDDGGHAAAVSQPASDTTPSFSSLGGLGSLHGQNGGFPGAVDTEYALGSAHGNTASPHGDGWFQSMPGASASLRQDGEPTERTPRGDAGENVLEGAGGEDEDEITHSEEAEDEEVEEEAEEEAADDDEINGNDNGHVDDGDHDHDDAANDDDYDEGSNEEHENDEYGEDSRVEELPGSEARATSRPIRRRKSTSQLNRQLLETEYLWNPRPSNADYIRILQTVSMDKKQLQVWFQNRRQRDRRVAGTMDAAVLNGAGPAGLPHQGPLEAPRVRADAVDGWLNFADICTAAQTDVATRSTCLRLLSGHGVVPQRHGQPWIPFEDGWFLCQRLDLDPAPLVMPGLPAPEEPPNVLKNYLFLSAPLPPAYNVLWWNEKAIPYRPQAQTVNATRLVLAMGLQRNVVQNWLAKRTVVRTYVRGNNTVQGTYLGLNDALQLCMSKTLDVYPVQIIAGECGIVLDDLAAATGG